MKSQFQGRFNPTLTTFYIVYTWISSYDTFDILVTDVIFHAAVAASSILTLLRVDYSSSSSLGDFFSWRLFNNDVSVKPPERIKNLKSSWTLLRNSFLFPCSQFPFPSFYKFTKKFELRILMALDKRWYRWHPRQDSIEAKNFLIDSADPIFFALSEKFFKRLL